MGKVEVLASKKALLVFDGEVLEIFGMYDAARVHVRGLEGIEISEGFARAFKISNRFGPDLSITYDKERLRELQDFATEVLKTAGLR